MKTMHPVSLEFCEKSYNFLKSKVRETPLLVSPRLCEKFSSQIYLKHENEQITGSFKVRGALNKIFSLTEEECRQGVVAASAGNHAQGLAYASAQRQAHSVIVMPTTAPVVKLKSTQDLGAHVILYGNYYDEAYQHARELEKKHNLHFVHPYEDPHIIAGQSSLGFEILKQCPKITSCVVAIGGGGLISGISSVLKSQKPDCKIYGVVTDNSPGMQKLFFNKPLDSSIYTPSLADGISVKNPSPLMHENYISKFVDDVVSVSEESIAHSMVSLLEKEKTLTEGSAAAVLAGALKAKWDLGEHSVFILGGGNVDLNFLSKLIQKELFKRQRIVELKLVLTDAPGGLAKITKLIQEAGGNILQVIHDRMSYHLGPKQVEIQLIFEIVDQAQLGKLKKSLSKEEGIQVLG